MGSRLLVAYGTDLLVRGFHTTPPDRFTPDGSPANGLFAVARALRHGLGFKTPERAVAVIDRPAEGEVLLPGEPAGLRAQLPLLRSLLEAHGFAVVESPRGAHLVASYVQAALDDGSDAVVLASDKRFAQLVSASVWWFDAYKRVRYTPDSVRKRFGVDASHVADWLALVGDDTTPCSGVKGVGAKGAADLVAASGSLRTALEDPDAVEGRVGKALRKVVADARVQLELAELRRDVPLPRALAALDYAAPEVETLNESYAQLGFFKLLVADTTLPPCDVLRDAPASGFGKRASIHALTEGPTPVRGDFVGLAVVSSTARFFFPTIGPRLKVWLEDAAAVKNGHDVKATTVALARVGVTLRGIHGDAILASHLVDPSGSAPHELDQLARVRLRRPLVGDESLLGTGKGRKRWSDLPTDRVGAYACHLAEAAGDLWRHFAAGVKRDQALYEENLALSETLVQMELAGMAVDDADLATVGEDFAAIQAELEHEIHALAGKSFNVGSTKQLAKVLFEELKLTVVSRTRTGYSTATHALERIAGEHPIVPLVIRHRMLSRLESNWVNALRAAIGPDGRVHSTFHPARSFSGRLVNAQPDLGRVPGATPEMSRIRHAFVAQPGWTLLSVDYDQLGLYVLAHMTRDPALVDPLARGDDMHTLTAAAVLDLPVQSIDRDRRQVGKVTNFATFAGQGASALRMQLGVSVDEAKTMIARFKARYATVMAFQDEQLRLCQERGWVTTISGRRWPIRDVHSNDLHMRAYGERLARRAPHEGSVADVTRRGLLCADQALRAAGSRAFPLLQIHDEVLFEVPDGEVEGVARLAGEAMRTAYDLVVPLRVDFKAGKNWADMKRLPRDTE